MSTEDPHLSSASSEVFRKKITIIDSHHHFLDPQNNPFQAFLKSLNAPTYLPFQYEADVIDPIFKKHGIQVEGTVHMEALPDDGIKEVQWIEHLIHNKKECSYVKAIVASCNLSSPTAEAELECLTNGSIHSNLDNYENKVKGIRWVLDCVGPFDAGKTATHVATTRFDLDGMDYLRCYSKESGISCKYVYNGTCSPEFEKGFSLLEKYNLTFDLQCAPEQLMQAYELCKRYPKTKVCINHLGKPQTVIDQDNPVCEKKKSNDTEQQIRLNESEIQTWKQGLIAMSKLSNVYIKISMLGYVVPGWISSPEKESVLKALVKETIDMFRPKRCMIATNWYVNGALSDADGLSEIGPTSDQLIGCFLSWFEEFGLSEDQIARLFAGTAKEFYRIY